MLVSALLVKNESAKDLVMVLDNARSFADLVLVLDDGSTDDSVRVSKRHGAVVRRRHRPGMWGNESPARRDLWVWAAEMAGPEGWVLIQDADQVLSGDPRPFCDTDHLNTWCFPLYDLWDSPTTYRCDGFWQAHTMPRPWLFCPSRVPTGWVPEWSPRGIHTGHCPTNFPMVAGVADGLVWHHRAYLTAERRRVKLTQYLAKADQLTPWEMEHARSIGDP